MKFRLNNSEHHVSLRHREPELVCDVNGREYKVVESRGSSNGLVSVTINGRPFQIYRAIEGDQIHLHMNGRTTTLERHNPLNRMDATGTTSEEIRADMPGVVVELHCQVNDTVTAGTPLVTIESMKMQVALQAPYSGRVVELPVAENDAFDKLALLVRLAPANE